MSKEPYYWTSDGEWIEVPWRGGKDQCCDCGLIHRVNYRIVDGKIHVQVFRDPKATGGARRHKKKARDF